jgi:AraC-like DNA-binding protein
VATRQTLGIENLSVLYCKKATEYIADNYQQDIRLPSLCGYVGLSRSQLYRVFMEVFHMSPNRYITEYRIEQASRLLKTALTVSEVANSVGFSDSLYFSIIFKKIKGISSSEYRIGQRE